MEVDFSGVFNFILDLVKGDNSFVVLHWLTDVKESDTFGVLFERVISFKPEDWSVTVKLGHRETSGTSTKGFSVGTSGPKVAVGQFAGRKQYSL